MKIPGFILPFIALCILVLPLTVSACGWGPDFEYCFGDMPSSYFEYSTVPDKLFLYTYPALGLFANPYQNYQFESSDLILDEISDGLQKQANLKEWAGWAGLIRSVSNFSAILYGDSHDLGPISVKPGGETYYKFMKDVEPCVSSMPWYDDGAAKKLAEKRPALFNQALNLLDAEPDPFLKARYIYQAIRLAELDGKDKDAIEIFNNDMAGMQKYAFTWFSALGYKARALWNTGKKTDALLAYRQIFDQYPPLMIMVWLSLKSLEPDSSLWEQVRSGLKSDYQKETIWMLQDLATGREDDMEAIDNMISLAPKTVHPEVIMLRKISMLEQSYLTTGEVKQQNTTIPRALADKCLGYVHDRTNLHSPDFWKTAAAYLYWMSGDQSSVMKTLETIRTKNPVLTNQKALIRTLSELTGVQGVPSVQVQQDFLSSLSWAEGLKKEFNNWKIYYSLCRAMAGIWMKAGDRGRASACFQGAGLPSRAFQMLYTDANDQDLTSAIAFLQDKTPQPSDKNLKSMLGMSVDDITFLRGRKFIEKEQYAKAVEVMKDLSEAFWKKNGHSLEISDQSPDICIWEKSKEAHYYGTAYDYQAENKGMYRTVSLLEYARLMQRLTIDAVASDTEKAAKACFAAANIYYTLTSTELVLPPKAPSTYETAANFYQKAFNLTSDKELSFKCLVLFGLASKDAGERNYDQTPVKYGKKFAGIMKLFLKKMKGDPKLEEYKGYCPELSDLEK